MFSNLSKGSILYGLDTNDGKMQFFTANVEEVKPAFPIKLGQAIGAVVDIQATKDGKTLSFNQIPSNSAIADYGKDSFILADSRESLVNYITSRLQTSKNIVNSYEENKKLIQQYEQILEEINPTANSGEIKDLKKQLADMQGQFSEILSLLKGNNNTQKP